MRPRVVLDTDALLQAAPDRGAYRRIILALAAQEFELVISNEILLEYEEILTRLGSETTWPGFRRLAEPLHLAGTVHQIDPTYRWKVIAPDPDDDKFVDAAVAGGAEYIITDDHHFDILTSEPMLQIRPMSPLNFIALLDSI